MGFETANVHLGTPRIRQTLRKQLAARRGHWLHEAAKLLSAEVVRDWRDWTATAALRQPGTRTRREKTS